MKNPLIAERLKFYRKKNNLSVEQVSALLSEIQPVAPKTIYGWESGHTQPDADTLYSLLVLYNVSPNTFFGYDVMSMDVSTEERELMMSWNALTTKLKRNPCSG